MPLSRYRRIPGERGDPYPEWLRDLRRKQASGVYVIRDLDGVYLYVGSSRTGRLYGTLTRHFQTWTPTARARFGSRLITGRDTTGARYERDEVEVAIEVMADDADRVFARESELIRRFAPIDNELGQDEEVAPAETDYDYYDDDGDGWEDPL